MCDWHVIPPPSPMMHTMSMSSSMGKTRLATARVSSSMPGGSVTGRCGALDGVLGEGSGMGGAVGRGVARVNGDLGRKFIMRRWGWSRPLSVRSRHPPGAATPHHVGATTSPPWRRIIFVFLPVLGGSINLMRIPKTTPPPSSASAAAADYVVDLSRKACKCRHCGRRIQKGEFRVCRWLLYEHHEKDRMTHAFHWACALAAAVYDDLPETSKVVAIHADIIENPQREVVQKGKWIREEFAAALDRLQPAGPFTSRTTATVVRSCSNNR